MTGFEIVAIAGTLILGIAFAYLIKSSYPCEDGSCE